MTSKLITRRTTLKALGTGALTASTFSLGMPAILRAQDGPIKLGFLSGLTGLETILGETQLNCFKLAVSEINNGGGIAGRQVEFIVEDDQTTTRGAIDKARKLVSGDQVDAIIGLIASLTHVAARSVTTPAKKLLIYTTYYEGSVCDRYFFSTGQIPNQQIVPSVEWLTVNAGKSTYIIGSDYVWPRESAKAIHAAMEASGGKVLGEDFLPFGTQDFGPVFDRVRAADPDFLWVMVAGNDLITCLKQYQSFGFRQQLFSNGLDELFSFFHPELTAGTLSNQAYFMGLENEKNLAFKKAYGDMFGADKPINAIGEAAYNAVHLYKLAVEKAGSTETEAVIDALGQVEFDAPQGKVNFAANNVMRSNSILARGNDNGHWDTIENFGQIDPDIAGCSL
ncbi:substrate-binding protein [Shinella kummerowiae]|uniref:substrate-binding protein n=1 Tax=Shinella kummerowiae TaxID=417745 RepID=UPI0021B4F39C|nr:substrate-binding protein [Shinella kummerowiae]MCT7667459.1 substrate-binding protein [Shinella kummerowiae]